MTRYEYQAIPAPQRGDKLRGLKTPGDRFAHALVGLLNEMGQDGWEYLRAETLPSEERSGLTGRATVFHNLLIFRRALVDDQPALDAEAVSALMLPPQPEVDAPPAAPSTTSPQDSAVQAAALAAATAATQTAPQHTAPAVSPRPPAAVHHDYDPDMPVPADEPFFDGADTSPLRLEPSPSPDRTG